MAPSSALSLPVVAQSALALSAIIWLGLTPPADGAMLVLPVAGQRVGDVLQFALARDARLIAEGPVAGSVVVVGRRDPLAADAVANGLLLLAAPPAICGDLPETRR